ERQGPAVDNDVVKRQKEEVFGLIEFEQRHAIKRSSLDIKRPSAFFAKQSCTFRCPRLIRRHAQVDERNRYASSTVGIEEGIYNLSPPTMLVREGRPQRLVTPDALPKALLQDIYPEVANQTDTQRDNEGCGAGIELIEEPQSLLRIRQGYVFLPLNHNQR